MILFCGRDRGCSQVHAAPADVLIEVLASTGKHNGPSLRTTVTGPLAEIVPDPVEEYPMTSVSPVHATPKA